jgi:C_GCAxxG_C_C family probable redox protein
MKKAEKASEYFRNKFNCSQSVFTVFGTGYGISEDNCLKVSCAFGAGMGRTQNTCGAVTGGIMALGLRYGKALHDPEDKKLETYAKTREFFKEFKIKNGTLSCRELLNGLDINDPGDYNKILEQKLFENNCSRYVADAVAIIEKMI